MAAERTYVESGPEPLSGVRVLEQPSWSPLHWESIVGGWLIGLAVLVFLSVIGIATGLSAFNAGTAAATGRVPTIEAGANSAIWAGVSAIIAYLIGGFFAARIVRTVERDRGAANGLMVFLLSIPFMLVLAGLGASGAMGAVGGLTGGALAGLGGQITNQAGNAAASVSPAEAARAAEVARNAAWTGLVIGLICLAASALGGFFGAQPIETTREVVRRR